MMQSKKFRALAMVGALTMAVCTGTTAMAEEAAPMGNSPEIQKIFQMSEGMDVPSVSFKFTLEKVTADAPTAQVSPIDYNSNTDKGNLTNGVYLMQKNQQINFGEFPHAGKYTYKVTEVNESVTNTNITYDQNTYYMDVYVENTENGLQIANTVARDGENKTPALSFLNTYRRQDASLTVTKHTSGSGDHDLADKTKDFDFTITMYRAATDDNTSYTGKIGNETVTLNFGTGTTATASFKLHDGENLVFTGLAAGTRYKVVETGAADDYTPGVKVVENGTATVNKTASSEPESLATADGNATNLIGEKENTVDFTNTYKNVPITGVIMNHMTAIVLILAAVSAMAVLFLTKRRQMR